MITNGTTTTNVSKAITGVVSKITLLKINAKGRWHNNNRQSKKLSSKGFCHIHILFRAINHSILHLRVIQ